MLQNQYLKSLIIFWLLSNVVTSVRRFRQTAWVLALMSIPLSLTGVNNYVTGTFLQSGDVALHRIRGYEAGMTANPNDLALMLNLVLPLTVALLLTERGPFCRVVLLGAIASSILAIVLTFSRAGFVTLASIGLVYLWQFRRRTERRWVYLALLLALACVPLLPGTYGDRIATMTDATADATGSSEARWRDTGAALSFILKHPIVGAGIGSDQLALNAERGAAWGGLHNVYLQYALELGIPGLVFFLLILFGCLRRLRAIRLQFTFAARTPDLIHFAQGIEVTLYAFAVGALFHPVAYHFYFYYMAGLALGLSTGPGRPLTSPAA
jgi:putative inorganic carbon (HCO3(-)) transporter